jgi:hypothetical protein
MVSTFFSFHEFTFLLILSDRKKSLSNKYLANARKSDAAHINSSLSALRFSGTKLVCSFIVRLAKTFFTPNYGAT